MSVAIVTDKPENHIVKRFGIFRWVLLAVVQLALISIPLMDRLHVQMTGEVVILDLVPVDPRDLLRGDYVIINLAITRVAKEIPGTEKAKIGDILYATLDRDETGSVRVLRLSDTRDKAGSIALEGIVTSVKAERVTLDYGIDAFFLPEGEGLKIENLDTSRVKLEVSVAKDGRSLPVRLLVDGKAFRSDALF